MSWAEQPFGRAVYVEGKAGRADANGRVSNEDASALNLGGPFPRGGTRSPLVQYTSEGMKVVFGKDGANLSIYVELAAVEDDANDVFPVLERLEHHFAGEENTDHPLPDKKPASEDPQPPGGGKRRRRKTRKSKKRSRKGSTRRR